MIRGRVWIRLLLILAALRLYSAFRALLIWLGIRAELLVECGDHDGRMRFLDLPLPDGSRVRTGDDD